MTKYEAIQYIDNYTWSTMRLGLDRTRELLERLGNPQKQLKFVHVAGSNGKGSTCAMLDAVLRKAGLKTGLYTSPFIQDFCERMRICGKNIPGPRLAELTEQVKSAADAMEDHPSQFELVTAIGMLYFAQEHCDIVVLEVGLGGLLDSTNVIDAPEVAVITNIGLEHTEFLGNTIPEIAQNKVGIIKPGSAVVCYDGEADAKKVVEDACRKAQDPLLLSDFSKLRAHSCSLQGQIFDYRERTDLHLNLIGDYQLNNAAVALDTLDALRTRGWNISEEAIREGLAQVEWPARFEVFRQEPLFILDGGHNPQCVDALCGSLKQLLPGKKYVFLLGVLADKDYQAMMAKVIPLAQEFICLTPFSDRALPAADLAEYLNRAGAKAQAFDQVKDGIRSALDAAGEDGILVSFGSLYLAGAVRTEFPKVYRTWLRHRKISARDSLTVSERTQKSASVCEKIRSTKAYQNAKTILLYRAVRGEVSLEPLIQFAEADGKRIAYPLCISESQMEARIPVDENGWHPGAFHIPEPVPEHSDLVPPEEIDLVISPLTAFDESCMRMGMGAGYYDRYLPKCTNAEVMGAAFEAQKTGKVPAETWDVPLDAVITEKERYLR